LLLAYVKRNEFKGQVVVSFGTSLHGQRNRRVDRDFRPAKKKENPELKNRHRGKGHPSSPATPPYMRVRIRRFGGLS
ncbi:MAG TPA: hypothetical protein VGV15_17050, partial [Terriglobales bacterium]|nr:hypothetical protein [Terriglobales bacterium]